MNADELQLFQMGIANLKFLNHKLFAICDHSQLILLHLYVVANVTTQSGNFLMYVYLFVTVICYFLLLLLVIVNCYCRTFM